LPFTCPFSISPGASTRRLIIEFTTVSSGIRLIIGLLLIAFFISAGSSTFDLDNEQKNFIIFAIVGYTLFQIVTFKQKHFKKPIVQGLTYFFDIILATILIFWTGREQSMFSSLYFLPILESTFPFGLKGGFGSASLSAFLFIFTMVFPNKDIPIQWFTGINHILAFVTIGLMSGLLRSRLNVAKETITRLQNVNDTIVNNISSGIVLFDKNKNIISINPAGKKILDVQENNLGEIFNGFSEKLNFEGATSEDRAIVHYNHPKKGRRDLGYTMVKLKEYSDSDSQATLFSFQDLTKIHQIQQQLFNSKKLAAIGSLAASIAHEIRNPLASISGCVEMLKIHVPNEVEPQKLLNIVIKETDRLNQLIGEFLNYVGKENLVFSRTDLKVLLHELIEQVRLSKDLNKNISIEFNPPPEKLMASVDINKLKQAMLNILLNSIQSMEHGGVVEITTAFDAETIEISFKDTGIGIPPENIEKIFEPFFTTKKKGTGLGLAMTQKIIERHDGKISVESILNEGTTFHVWIKRLS